VFVHGSSTALGPGRSVQLRDGLRVRLGDYVLGVQLTPEVGAANPAASGGARAEPASELFDASWFRGKPLGGPTHPARAEPSPAFTRSDHAVVDEVALDLPRRPSPFDEALPSPEEPSPSALPDRDWRSAPSEAPALVPTAAAAPPPPPPTAGDARQLLAAFLEGAGLAAGDVPPDQDLEALLRDLGRRYRMMAGGLVELLLLRAALKREAGLDRTMIAASGNNPLKLTATGEEAVRWLVRHRGAGYLAPDRAITAALDDLKSFMPELVQAMQGALQTLLHRFDPKSLEQALADASLLQILAAGGRKAKYWELFKERYEDLAGQAEAEFLREVGIDIARGRRGVRKETR
jgi:type VI secretion system protein ImpI